jgi:hypothetical protein
MQWKEIRVRIVKFYNAENCQKRLGLTLTPEKSDPKP